MDEHVMILPIGHYPAAVDTPQVMYMYMYVYVYMYMYYEHGVCHRV